MRDSQTHRNRYGSPLIAPTETQLHRLHYWIHVLSGSISGIRTITISCIGQAEGQNSQAEAKIAKLVLRGVLRCSNQDQPQGDQHRRSTLASDDRRCTIGLRAPHMPVGQPTAKDR